MKKIIYIAVLLLAGALPAVAAGEAGGQPAGPDIKYKVNLVMDDGTAIFYAGSKQGVKVGDEFDVYRGAQKVGTLKVTKVKDLASYGKAQGLDLKEMDGLAPGAKATATAPKTMEKSEEDLEKEKAKKEAAEKKKKDDAEKKKKSDEEKAKKKAEAEANKPAEPAKKPEPVKKPEPPARQKEEIAESFGAPTYFGTGGLFYMPTAEGVSTKMGLFASNVKHDYYKDTGIGFGYNADNKIEAAFTRINTKMDSSPLSAVGVGFSLQTNVISLKYIVPSKRGGSKGAQPRTVKIPGTKKKVGAGTGEINYAAGLVNYKVTGTLSLSSLGLRVSDSVSATRFYVVGSSDYNNMKVHAGFYTQGGDLLDGTTDDGFGFMAGLEYPLGGGDGGMMSGLSLIAEYDDKAFYLETMRTPSVGLRYNGGKYSVTLGLLDATQEKIFSLGGSYGF